jgi:hypothetical protein
MTIARAHLIDPLLTRWYHCVTRCVRRAYLLGNKEHNRKEWIESRLQELAGCFAVAVGGFSVMNNHLHVLLRLDPDVAAGWSDEEVVRRWGRLCPPRDKSRRELPVCYRRLGSMAPRGRPVGGDNPRAIAKHKLVYEIFEGTAGSAGQSSR